MAQHDAVAGDHPFHRVGRGEGAQHVGDAGGTRLGLFPGFARWRGGGHGLVDQAGQERCVGEGLNVHGAMVSGTGLAMKV